MAAVDHLARMMAMKAQETADGKADPVTYIAGSNISISSVDRYVDLFEYTWSNVAPNSTTSWQTIPDSKSLNSAVIDLESVTKFKLQAATKQTHTIFFSGAFVDSSDVLHDFPSSALNQDGTIKQDTEIDVPSGYTGMVLLHVLTIRRISRGLRYMRATLTTSESKLWKARTRKQLEIRQKRLSASFLTSTRRMRRSAMSIRLSATSTPF